MPICRHFYRTGATGLEPATSGVTGRQSAGAVRGIGAATPGEKARVPPTQCPVFVTEAA